MMPETDAPFKSRVQVTLHQMLRARHVVVRTALVAATAVFLVTSLRPRTWTADLKLMVQASKAPTASTSAAVLAQQLGIGGGVSDGAGFSTPMIPDLARSRAIRRSLAVRKVQVHSTAGRDSMTVADLLGAEGASPAARAAWTGEKLLDRIDASVNRITGAVSISISLPDSVAAKSAADVLLDLLKDFQVNTRQSQAGAERRFVEARVAEVAVALRNAEERFREYSESNRAANAMPSSRLVGERLQREVSLQRDLYLSLATSLERARIDEVRDVPALTVVEPPTVPMKPDSRGRLVATIWGALFGAMLALGWLLLRSTGASELGRDRETRLDSAWSELRRDLARPWRLLFPPTGNRP